MTTRLLPRQSHGTARRPALPFLGDLALATARVHEGCGAARLTLAMMIAARLDGPVVFIQPAWGQERMNGAAVQPFVDPGRFLFVHPRRPEDLLWVMEEALRSGAVPLVIADLPGPPGLTAVRRLHLAAETGAAEGRHRPLGLLLTPGDGGAQGVESRWHMAPAHDLQEAWTLSRRRARTDPPKSWRIEPGKDGHRLIAQGGDA